MQRFSGCVVPIVTVLLAGVSSLAAQTATVDTEENFRAEPNGTILASIRPGTVLGVEALNGQWVQGSLEGWIWRPSVAASDLPGFDLRVAVSGGENLRVEPQGTILASLREGTLLEEIETRENWIRVRRSAWIWRPSVELVGGGPTEPLPSVQQEEEPATEWRSAGPDGLAILATPDGDTLATSAPGTEVRVLARRGNWVRVQLDGWTWLPSNAEIEESDASVLAGITPDSVESDPERFRGRSVEWTLQFISAERAEPIRTDFYEGEPYMLTRRTGEASEFVYVAIPPERVEEIEALTPLENVRVVGRVREGRAALTGGPILDLLELSRQPGAPTTVR